ncbi:putative amidoligase enzyme-domain-containing protein [Pyronema omphalodes]|nr:putative amidoligase enzyme-domain-containing protein [Pyronema omphalodes]
MAGYGSYPNYMANMTGMTGGPYRRASFSTPFASRPPQRSRSTSSPYSTPPSFTDLTFGIELELIVTLRDPYSSRNPPSGVSLRSALYNRLSRHLTFNRPGSIDYTRWSITTDVSINYNPHRVISKLWGYNLSPSSHPVRNECVEIATSTGYSTIGFASVEIVSPVFRFGIRGWRKEVDTILAVLNDGDFRTTVNPSCGMHIHIGRGNQGFQVQDLKRFAAVALSLQRRMDGFHADCRRGNRFCQANKGSLQAISRCRTNRELVHMFHADARGELVKYYKVNFIPVLRGGKGTVEFRQHRGSITGQEIGMWVNFVGKFVAGAMNTKAWDGIGLNWRYRDPLWDEIVRDEELRKYYNHVERMYQAGRW